MNSKAKEIFDKGNPWYQMAIMEMILEEFYDKHDDWWSDLIAESLSNAEWITDKEFIAPKIPRGMTKSIGGVCFVEVDLDDIYGREE